MFSQTRTGAAFYYRLIALGLSSALAVAGCKSRPETQAAKPLKAADRSVSKKAAAGAAVDTGARPPATAERENKAAAAGAPRRGCALLKMPPVRVRPESGPVSIAALQDSFAVAGFTQNPQGEELWVAEVAPKKTPRLLRSVRLSRPLPVVRTARPGLAVKDQQQIFFGFIDGAGSVLVGNASAGQPRAGEFLEQISSGADTRFTPALAWVTDLLAVAWTAGATPMWTELALVNGRGKAVKRHAVAPDSMGAAAPVFIAGARPPVMLAVDARAGYSPVIRVPLAPDGTPGSPEVRSPISMVFTPPELAAARGAEGTFLVYTGFGGAATSAIGLSAIDPPAGAPTALVPGTAYGMLYVAAASAPRAPVFAVDAPQKGGVDAPREIQVRLIDAQGPGPAAVVRGPDGAANGAALARDASGLLAVAFSSPSGVHVAWARCDDD